MYLYQLIVEQYSEPGSSILLSPALDLLSTRLVRCVIGWREDLLLVGPTDHVSPLLLSSQVSILPLGVNLHHAVEVAEEEASVRSVDDGLCGVLGVHLGFRALQQQPVLQVVLAVQEEMAGCAGGVGQGAIIRQDGGVSW